MSTPPKISVNGLAKAFQLNERRKVKGVSLDLLGALGYLLRQTLQPGKAAAAAKRGDKNVLFALDEVNFDVYAGEVVGIIGRNGAGKSTLLKILARVLDPTEGRVTLRGRVVSLLELGIGFAPDLTVGENIEIYGRLAGVSAAKIRAARDSILEMARLSDFRDIPLRLCPSGSFIQLAFAAMTNLDADIILADEVLTVGDSAFRRACEERIRGAAQSGESVLLVSHDMQAIRRCCSRAIWIDKGRIRQEGPAAEIADAYTRELLAGRLDEPNARDVGVGCRILEVRLLDADRQQIGGLQMTEDSYIDCLVRVERPDIAVTVQLELRYGQQCVFVCATPNPLRTRVPLTYSARLRIPAHFFNESRYQAQCRAYVREFANPTADPILAAEESLDFSVMNTHPEKSVWVDWSGARGGVISPRLDWTLRQSER